ncbi:MAG: hypothetical protein K9N09_09480, partial [Candidatus Cloacimonetes bacterium]|nr:hypothetical protein [Candidatus Cloacimonadota bacterium]
MRLVKTGSFKVKYFIEKHRIVRRSSDCFFSGRQHSEELCTFGSSDHPIVFLVGDNIPKSFAHL